MAKRRTKLQMKWMKEDVTEWLLKYENDPHTAWDEYCKYLILNNHLRDHYIRGKQDFIKISQELTKELERQRQLKAQKEASEKERKQIEQKIKQMTWEQAKELWKTYKDNLSQNEKIILADLMNQIQFNEFNVTQTHINLYKKLSLQTA
ncbi:hypothetical protein [Bacillus smithii]|uniref:hypothetical protein n=1 Tax=Bacillus smithii TaxID=1479 RepID=UPI002E1A7DBB|nr:hypothetical protein [Bacillus smithii]MED4928976.1 hypothetical protein [Bacillus smithii]